MKLSEQARARRNERGFALIETIIGLAMFAIVLTIGLQMLFVRAASIENTARQRAANEWSEAALEALTAGSVSSLPATNGSFDLAADKSIQLTNPCTPQTCDYVLDPSPALGARTSPARGVPWASGYAPPAGSSVQFIRRWRIDVMDAALGLRQITVVVIRDETSSAPLTVQQTIH